MLEHIQFYLHGYVFTACAAVVWAVVHELAKYAIKRWLLKIPYE